MNHLLGKHHRFMQEVGGTRWSLAAALLVTHGFHVLSCSRGPSHLNVLSGQPPLTLKHILFNCADFLALHQQFYSAGNMHDLFSKVKQEEMFAFLRMSDLYHCI